jgi:peptide/nickel transport system permease protein
MRVDDSQTPAGLDGTPPVGPLPRVSARRLRWRRRRRALAATWAVYRRSMMGLWGVGILGVFIALALLAPVLADAQELNPSLATAAPLQAPDQEHRLGTDDLGRPVSTLLIYGARISLLVGFAATVVTMVIGSAMGIAAGYFGGRVDSMLNAVTNWFLVIPWIALAIVMAAVLGPSLFNIILVIGVTSWASTARLVRAQTLSIKNRSYVERARALGAGRWPMIRGHVLPNVFPVIFANTILTVASAILAETTLSLLGLGDPRSVSWGTIIGESFDAGALTIGAWWWIMPPGLCVVAVVLAFTMCGYALDEVINPRLRDR